jgi:hypothetical protein
MPKLLAAAARSIQKLGCVGLEAVDDAEPRQRLADEHIIVEPRHFGITPAGQFEARGATRDTIARNMMLGEPVGNLLRLREHTALVRSQSVADLLVDCVNFGGDVDTVAAIAMAACADDIVRNIPETLWNGLENGRFGRDRLIELDWDLQDFARRHGAPME